MRFLTLAAVVVLAGGCDDFGRLGTCDQSSHCAHATPPPPPPPVCSVDNPVFVQDLWFADAGEVPSAVWVGADGGVWVGTQSQSIYRQAEDGGWAQEFNGAALPPTSGVNAFFGIGDSPEFAGGFGGFSRSRAANGGWSAANIVNDGSDIFAFSGTPSSDVWVAAASQVVHRENGAWVPRTPSVAGIWQGVWASDSNVLVAGYSEDGGHEVAQVDGGLLWGSQGCPAGGQFESIWGAADNDVYAVGVCDSAGAFLCHWNGVSWSCGSLSGTHAYGLWGRNANDIWATSDGLILHQQAGGLNGWPSVAPGFNAADGGPANLYRITGNATQVWAAGQTLVHCP